jgi:hypothetical protein
LQDGIDARVAFCNIVRPHGDAQAFFLAATGREPAAKEGLPTVNELPHAVVEFMAGEHELRDEVNEVQPAVEGRPYAKRRCRGRYSMIRRRRRTNRLQHGAISLSLR